MENILLWIIGAFLLIISIIDLKFRKIPSVLLTAFMIVVLVLNPANLFIGIIGFLFAYLLLEFDYFKGLADVKVFTIIALLCSSFNIFIFFLTIFMILGVAWKGIIKWKFPKEEEFAFIPVFFFTYLVLVVGGVL